MNKQPNNRISFFISVILLLFLFSYVLSVFLFHYVNAQNQYQTTGTILPTSTNCHLIYSVHINDVVFISINPVESASYVSAVYSPNITRVGYGSQSSFDYPKPGSHSYQFIAEENGNYLLKLWTTDTEFNYIVTSSHQVSSGNPLEATLYTSIGEIGGISTNFHIIQNVKANDLVILSLNGFKGDPNAIIFSPTLLSVDVNVGNFFNGSSHSFQFVAKENGNYLYKLWTSKTPFSYMLRSSHPVSSGSPLEAAPYSSVGAIGKTSTNWFTISNVKANDLVLIGIDRVEEADSYSEVFSPTLSSVDAYRGNFFNGSSHSYQFIAGKAGNYLLKLWTADYAYNYTAKSSHPIAGGTSQPTPTATQTTALPTVSPSPTTSPNVVTIATFSYSPTAPSINESVLFDAKGSQSSGGNIIRYEWNFGDGTSEITTNSTASHNYFEAGDFNATLTIFDASGGQDSHSSIVSISPVPTREDLVAPIAVGTGAATTVAVGVAIAKVTATGTTAAAQNAPNLSELPRSEFQKFLNFLVGKEQEEKRKKDKGKQNFLSTKKGQLAAISISVAIMTLIFSYVESNGLPKFFDTKVLELIVPTTLLSTITVKVVSILTDTICAQSCGVDKRYTIWPIGVITFIATGLLILFPFASPGIIKTYNQSLSPKQEALLSMSRTLLVLALACPFAVLAISGYGLLADAGLLSLLTMAFFSLVPIDPLPGRALASYSKKLSIAALMLAAVLLYGFMLNIFPEIVFLAAGALSGVAGGTLLYKTRSTALNKRLTPENAGLLPPPQPP